MLYLLLVPLVDEFGPFNLFRYLTFRTGGAVLTALIVAFVAGPGQPIPGTTDPGGRTRKPSAD